MDVDHDAETIMTTGIGDATVEVETIMTIGVGDTTVDVNTIMTTGVGDTTVGVGTIMTIGAGETTDVETLTIPITDGDARATIATETFLVTTSGVVAMGT